MCRAKSAIDLPTFVPRVSSVVLSRGELATIIQAYELYPEKRKWLPMEDVIEQMRSDVSIQNVRPNSIVLSFSHSDRYQGTKGRFGVDYQDDQRDLREELESMRGTTQLLRDSAKLAAAKWPN